MKKSFIRKVGTENGGPLSVDTKLIKMSGAIGPELGEEGLIKQEELSVEDGEVIYVHDKKGELLGLVVVDELEYSDIYKAKLTGEERHV